MKKWCFTLSLVLGLTVSAKEIVVPNFNFQEIYKPGSDTITGVLSGGGWTQGVGPDCPIDNGEYIFSDTTPGTVADIPGWIGYDRDGWIAFGGTYDRDQTTGNLQGSIQAKGVGGSYCYLANGSEWGNPAGGLIVSDAPLENVEDGTYTLSMVANGSAGPVVLELLAGGVVLTPTSSVDPVLTGDFQEFSRTYESDSLVDFLGEPLTICLGVGRDASGTQAHFDNVSLTVTGTRCPSGLIASGGAGGVTLSWQNGGQMPTSVRILRDTQEIENAAPVDPPTYTDTGAPAGLIEYELIFTMPGDACESLTTTVDTCISELTATWSEAGVELTWANNTAYAAIEITRDGEVLEGALSGSAEAYTDQAASPGFLTYTVAPTNGSCDPATVTYDACITDLAATLSEEGPVLTWRNNMAYEDIEITRAVDDGPSVDIETSLDGTVETYTDEDISGSGIVSYTVAPTNGTCEPATVEIAICTCDEPECIEIVVPNSKFEAIYQPGSDTITGVVSDGGWTQGVGPACPIDNGEYIFSDTTTGTVADIPGWIGYDRDGWIALGGSYERDQTTGNLQGSIGNQGLGVDGHYYLANGGDWANPAGGLIVSDAPLGNVEANVTYRLSVAVGGGAEPVVLELLAGGTVLTPTSSVDPVLTGDLQVFCRTYDSSSLADFLGEPLTICLGVGRDATGTQSRFDNVSLGVIQTGEPEEQFIRGDSNGDGAVNIADAVYILQNLFAQGPPILCPDAGDSNDDEGVNIADAIYILQNLFAQGPPIPPPTGACGPDTTSGTEGDLPPCDYPENLCQ